MHLLYPGGVRKGLPLAKENESKGLPERSEGNSPLRLSPLVKAMHLYPYTPLPLWGTGYGVRARGKEVQVRRLSPLVKDSSPPKG